MRNQQRMKLQYGGIGTDGDGLMAADGELAACLGLETIAGGSKATSLRHAPEALSLMPDDEVTQWRALRLHRMTGRQVLLLRRDFTIDNVERKRYSYLEVTQGYPAELDGEDLSGSHDIAGLYGVDVEQVSYVGNTLICRAADGELHYLVWKDAAYKYLGTQIPDLKITFGLQQTLTRFYTNHETLLQTNIKDAEDEAEDYLSKEDFYPTQLWSQLKLGYVSPSHFTIPEDKRADVTETIMAKVNKAVAECHAKGFFAQPFLVRYAIRMYDGTETMHSVPVLMPVAMPTMGVAMPHAVVEYVEEPSPAKFGWYVRLVRAALDMAADATQKTALEEWSDIVKGITIGVSAPIYTYDPAGMVKDVAGYPYGSKEWSQAQADSSRPFCLMPEYRSIKTIGRPLLHLFDDDAYPVRMLELPFSNTRRYALGNTAEVSAPEDNYGRRTYFVEAGTVGSLDGTDDIVKNGHAHSLKQYETLVVNSSDRGNAPILLNYQGQRIETAWPAADIEIRRTESCISLRYLHSGQSGDITVAYANTAQGAPQYGHLSILRNPASTPDHATREDDISFDSEVVSMTNGATRACIDYPKTVITPPTLSQTELNDRIRETSRFYTLAKIDLEDIPTERTIVRPKSGVLDDIAAQVQMQDEYHTHDQLKAEGMYIYNGRLNLWGVRRRLWQAFRPETMVPHQGLSTFAHRYVRMTFQLERDGQTLTLRTATGSFRVRTESPLQPALPLSMTGYIYYPEEHVKKLWIETSSEPLFGTAFTSVLALDMEQHTGLNGSVSKGNLEDALTAASWLPAGSVDIPAPDATAEIAEPAKLFTSDAMNPWVFEPKNINTVGQGRIMGLAVAAKSISAGTQAGLYPMYCMSESGVWIMQPNGTGGWASQKAVMGDVVTVPQAVVELDGAVMMPTARGILLLQGEDSTCVIDTAAAAEPLLMGDLPGLNRALELPRFAAHLSGIDVAGEVMVDVAAYMRSDRLRATYDYRNQRVVWWRTDKNVSLVYDLVNRQLMTQPWHVTGNVSSVADCLVMMADGDGRNRLVDLSASHHTIIGSTSAPMTLPNIGVMVTRPLKGIEIGLRDVRKQLDVVWHQGRFGRGSLNLLLWGTQDYHTWHLIGQAANATGLYGHHGAHWMAFVLAVIVTDMPTADHIDAVDLTMTPRLAGKSGAMVGYREE